MTLADLVQKAYQLATSKATAPSAGSSKYLKLVGFANICQDAWQNEPGVDWNSQYNTDSQAALISATNTFPLDATVRKVSNRPGDNITIVCTDGSIIEFIQVRPEELADYPNQNYVAKIGQYLRFARTFTATDREFGGTIKVPCYSAVSTLAVDADVVQVDIPIWLAYMTAAEYCRTDPQLNYLEDGLVARANDIMAEMKLNNAGQVEQVTRSFQPLGRTW
jgi:hypothetical protein